MYSDVERRRPQLDFVPCPPARAGPSVSQKRQSFISRFSRIGVEGAATLIAVAIVVAAIMLRNHEPEKGFEAVDGILGPKGDFFQYTDAGRALDASLKAALGKLQDSRNMTVDANLKDEAKIFADVFDA